MLACGESRCNLHVSVSAAAITLLDNGRAVTAGKPLLCLHRHSAVLAILVAALCPSIHECSYLDQQLSIPAGTATGSHIENLPQVVLLDGASSYVQGLQKPCKLFPSGE